MLTVFVKQHMSWVHYSSWGFIYFLQFTKEARKKQMQNKENKK